MIVMSDDFKKSVSATEREMKGYVEVSFVSSADKSTFTIDNEPEILSINGVDISDEGLLDDDRKGKNYASLEQDYFLLDGTFVLPNNDATKNPGMGYVSKYTFGQQQEEILEVNPFHFTTDATGCSGITIYFQNNVPTDLEIRVTADGTTETFTNIDISDNGVASVSFDERDVTDLYIVVNDMLYTNRRLRLQEVDFGLSAVYEGEDLISFKTIEQCDRFADEMPINECEVVLGDYEGKFDVNNPKGITQYLGENVLIKPFVGVITEDNGIEYCTLGTYWLDEWKSDKRSATLTAKSILNKLNDYDLMKDYKVVDDIGDFIDGINDNWNINTNSETINTYIQQNLSFYNIKVDSKINDLQKACIYCGNVFIEDRYGGLKYISNLEKPIGTEIKKQNLYENAIIDKKNVVNSFKVNEYMYNLDTIGNTLIYQSKYNVDNELDFLYIYDENEYYWEPTITIDCSDYSNLIIEESTSRIKDKNGNYIEPETYLNDDLTHLYAKIKYNGNINLLINSNTKGKRENTVNERKINNVGKDVEINNDLVFEFTNQENGYTRIISDKIINYRINYWNDKILNCKFNGNPAIECGDCIEVENKYSTEETPLYDKVWVTKIESEFKGSFNQTIEGDILEN